MELHGEKILITGADGFIGAHLTEELVMCGYDVRAFVYNNSFSLWGWLEEIFSEIMSFAEKIPESNQILLKMNVPITKYLLHEYCIDLGVVENYEKARNIYNDHFRTAVDV